MTSGVREARRVDWAWWRVVSGRSSKCCRGILISMHSPSPVRGRVVPSMTSHSLRCAYSEHTRVVWSTFANLGKSLTPESRMEMLEDRRALVDRSEDTQEESAFDMISCSSLVSRSSTSPGTIPYYDVFC